MRPTGHQPLNRADYNRLTPHGSPTGVPLPHISRRDPARSNDIPCAETTEHRNAGRGAHILARAAFYGRHANLKRFCRGVFAW